MLIANKLRRITTFVFDTLTCLLISLIILIISGITLTSFNIEPTGTELDVLTDVILFSTFFGYYFLFESITQRTLGKVLTRTMVVNPDGSKPELKSILKRTIFRTIPIEYLSFLHSRIGHHDLLSETRVIIKKKIDRKPGHNNG